MEGEVTSSTGFLASHSGTFCDRGYAAPSHKKIVNYPLIISQTYGPENDRNQWQLHSHGWGPRNADSAPILSRVYSLAYFAECEAKERLADEVSTGGMCNALSLY